MPVQTQMSSFAKKMGARVVQAHLEHKDKPIDAGMQRLPPGIKGGIAKLSAMYTKEYEDDKSGPGTKGQTFFRASAIAKSPESHNGQKVAGGVTSVVIPLCDMPAKGQRKAKSFSENWFEFQNLFKLLGVAPPNENAQTDPTGQRTEAYYFAAMKMLTDPDPTRKPVHISFSTRGWTPPATQAQPKPEEMVFEDWHGLAEWNGVVDPGSGVNVSHQPDPMSPPPNGTMLPPTEPFNEFASGMPNGTAVDPADVITALVEVAMNDPDGATEDGANAALQLEEAALANGWTTEQTAAAVNWAAVGDMALNPPDKTPPTTATTGTVPSPSPGAAPAVGGKAKFCKRTAEGAKLKDAKGQEFPPIDVEITAVDAAAKTCTVKNVKDGKEVVNIKTKKPVAVKFEWLE